MPRHYLLDDDEPVVYDANSISFTVAGNPLAQARARVASARSAAAAAAASPNRRTWWYDPNKRMKDEFRDVLDGFLDNKPYFADGVRLEMTVIFVMQSPTRGPDVDNMLKFVMDACQGYLYNDDNVVFHTEATKVLNNHTESTGSTHVMVRRL